MISMKLAPLACALVGCVASQPTAPTVVSNSGLETAAVRGRAATVTLDIEPQPGMRIKLPLADGQQIEHSQTGCPYRYDERAWKSWLTSRGFHVELGRYLVYADFGDIDALRFKRDGVYADAVLEPERDGCTKVSLRVQYQASGHPRAWRAPFKLPWLIPAPDAPKDGSQASMFTADSSYPAESQ